MIRNTTAYERGFEAGKNARDTLRGEMEEGFAWARMAYPTSAHLDYGAEIIKLDQERIANPPSLTRYPETKGWPDLVVAERQGFLDGCGGGPLELAFKYTWFFFLCKRMNTRYIGSPAGSANCTAVFIRDSKEGGPLYGRNWDVTNRAHYDVQPPRYGPDGKKRLFCKGVSNGQMCDEEPREIFPIEAWEVMPEDCRKLADVTEFVERYVEFWGTCNGIIVDEDLDCIAFEKTNCRIGWRKSDDGTAAVTACASVIPEMKQFREERHRQSLELRGLDESSADWKYWTGAEQRYHRLLKLVRAANQRGALLEDMAAIVTDHAVPYPERVCIAGETSHPDLDASLAEWTMRSRAAVLHGPNRRTLFYRVEDNKPCYENPPFLVLGEGVEMKPEWLDGTRQAPPSNVPDDYQESYRQYEFDYQREFVS
jgi:hypothetical protein